MIEIAVEAIKKAGVFLRENSRKFRSYRLKAEKDFVTRYDVKSEKYILTLIKKKFPKHNYISEESRAEDNGSRYTWIVDPLCSTNNYVFGLPFYGVSIALLHDKTPIIGVIYLPEPDYLLTAEKGNGAFLNGKRIYVSSRKKIENSLVLYDNQFYKDKRMYSNLLKIVKSAFTVRILGSAAYDLSLVAMGKADVRIFHKTKPCDFVAGGLIIEEAGGKVTNFKGAGASMNDTSVVASNGIIHDKILEVIK